MTPLAPWINRAVEENARAMEAAVARARNVQIILVGLALALGRGLAFLIARSIIRPVAGMTEAMRRLADGDTAVVVPSQDATDEIGAMAEAVEVFRQNALARAELESAQAAEQEARQRRTDRVDQLVHAFQQTIAQSLEVVTSAATELDATARSMTGSPTTPTARRSPPARPPSRPRPTSRRWRRPPRRWSPRSRRSSGRWSARARWPATPRTRPRRATPP
ncbi:HAMP domain-containing protein [Methylobacterium oryzae CBMB20]